MRKILLAVSGLLLGGIAFAQQKPLDHTVYDGWKSAGERQLSNDGKYAAYTINPQEGDGLLVIKGLDNNYAKEIPRGYQLRFTEDSRYLVFKIRPAFKDTREARIKKKKPDDMPKDTLVIFQLGMDSLIRIPRVKTFKTPEKGTGEWLAYHLEKALPEAPKPKTQPDSLTQLNNLVRMADSLMRVADSIKNKATEARTKGLTVLQPVKKESAKPAAKTADEPVEEGTELVLRNLQTGAEKRFPLTNEYYFSESGNVLVVETSRKNGDSLSKASVIWVNTASAKADTVFRRFNDAKNYGIDKAGTQLAFVAERDSSTKALQKFYKLYYYKAGQDSALKIADRQSPGVESGLTVSPDYANQFSENGSRLFFGQTPVRKPKDTTLVDFETARLDVWHFNDDYLQPQQQVQLQQELRRSFLSVYNISSGKLLKLGAPDAGSIQLVDRGNAPFVLATSNKGSRIATQWLGYDMDRAMLIDLETGARKAVSDPIRGNHSASPGGKYISWYDWKKKQYFAYNTTTGTTAAISKAMKQPVWDEDDDHPDDPPPHGAMGWTENDQRFLVYDKYDIWELDPQGIAAPLCITKGTGRATKTVYRYNRLDPEERFIKAGQELLLYNFNEQSKQAGFSSLIYGSAAAPQTLVSSPHSYQAITKAKNGGRYVVQRSNIQSSELYLSPDLKQFTKLTDIAAQQKGYNWLTVELMKWKMFDGKESEGLLFKPENFDPKKKYPVILYFYERDADGLYNYRAPAPSASTVNVPYFVSNGYLIFDPNIYYKNGEPGESAYNSVVSAAKMLAKLPYVDSTKMAIQGQSWGGYQVAYLITRTKMFAAAGAGAPVANMTSAYGGIRWGSGLNRQFQYEHTQSRIGATLWERRDLYIRNSPLFNADKVTTPLLMTHNDKDGAVPWYQGIEYFTALRRLNKTVWLLQYNDEDHNLVERRNRKDLSVRLGQFFDHFLKGAPMPKWMREGVPATEKGIEWGLE